MFCGVVIFPKIIVLPHVKNIVFRDQSLTEDVFSANLFFFNFFFIFFVFEKVQNLGCSIITVVCSRKWVVNFFYLKMSAE